MKTSRICLLLLLTFIVTANSQTLKIATYNIRFDNPSDTGNLWVQRAPIVANLIRFHDFDIFGTQEGLKHQLDNIAQTLPQYNRYGVGRTDGKEAGEFSMIFYKKDKFKLLNKGDFWLSQTPEKPSLGWDATCCNRICSWILLQDIKTQKKFYVFNVHFDHEGVIARKESSKLILIKIKQIAGSAPVILTGDFNGSQSSEWYQKLATSGILEDSFRKVDHPYVNNGTFNAFGKALSDKDIIDHVFISNHFIANKWGILTDSYHGRFPSDHFPVVVNLKFK